MSAEAVTVTEVRVLEGPNLYFTRPAVKVSLECPGYLAADEEQLRELGHRLGLRGVRPGARRLRPAAAVRHAPGGARRPARRARLGHHPARRTDPHRQHPRPGRRRLPVALAGPRRRPRGVAGHGPRTARRRHAGGGRAGHPGRRRARVGGRAGCAAGAGDPAHPRRVRDRHERQDHDHPAAGPHRDDRRARHRRGAPPTASSSRASCSRRATTPARPAPAPCSAAPGVQLGILETARGGMLLKGMGVSANDVSVVTNVVRRPPRAAGHRHRRPARRGQGDRHPGRPSRPAGSCSTVTTPGSGRCAAGARGRPWAFSLDPDSPALRESLNAGGRAATVLDGDLVVLSPDGGPRPPGARSWTCR